MTFEDERIERLERQLDAALARVDQLMHRVEALEDENDSLRRKLAENSSNSGKPPSSDPPADRRARTRSAPGTRQRGAQPGHKGSKRALLPEDQVDSTTDCHPAHCRRCARGLPKQLDPAPIRHQVWDLPTIKPLVHEYRQHRVTCEVCSETTCGTLPEGVPQGAFGPGVLALAAMLVADGHMSRRKVTRVLRDAFGIPMSVGALSESEAIVSAAVAPAVDEAYAQAVRAPVKHVDGTSWYESGAYKALWVLATTAVTVFRITPNASLVQLRAWLPRTGGVLVSDRGRQMTYWPMRQRQICWAHLIRQFVAFSERRGRAGEIGRDLLVWSRILIRTYHLVRDGTLPREELVRASRALRMAIERLLEEGRGLRVHGVSGSCRDILKHRNAMWNFVTNRDVEPTNNHAERELRGAVIWRKSTFGSRSSRGNGFAANLKSVIHTCRKQALNVLSYLTCAVAARFRSAQTPSLLCPAP